MTSITSSPLVAGIAPVCLIIASQVAEAVASEPVCERVARCPAEVCPPFQITTGLLGVVSRSALKKRRPSFSPSRYIPITSVSGSSRRYSR